MPARMAAVSAVSRLFFARLVERGWVSVPISRHYLLRWITRHDGHDWHASPSLILSDHVLLRVRAVHRAWMRSHVIHPRVVSLRLRIRVSHVRAWSRLIERINGVVRVLAWVVGVRH